MCSILPCVLLCHSEGLVFRVPYQYYKYFFAHPGCCAWVSVVILFWSTKDKVIYFMTMQYIVLFNLHLNECIIFSSEEYMLFLFFIFYFISLMSCHFNFMSFHFMVLGIESQASHMVGNCSTTSYFPISSLYS